MPCSSTTKLDDGWRRIQPLAMPNSGINTPQEAFLGFFKTDPSVYARVAPSGKLPNSSIHFRLVLVGLSIRSFFSTFSRIVLIFPSFQGGGVDTCGCWIFQKFGIASWTALKAGTITGVLRCFQLTSFYSFFFSLSRWFAGLFVFVLRASRYLWVSQRLLFFSGSIPVSSCKAPIGVDFLVLVIHLSCSFWIVSSFFSGDLLWYARSWLP